MKVLSKNHPCEIRRTEDSVILRLFEEGFLGSPDEEGIITIPFSGKLENFHDWPDVRYFVDRMGILWGEFHGTAVDMTPSAGPEEYKAYLLWIWERKEWVIIDYLERVFADGKGGYSMYGGPYCLNEKLGRQLLKAYSIDSEELSLEEIRNMPPEDLEKMSPKSALKKEPSGLETGRRFPRFDPERDPLAKRRWRKPQTPINYMNLGIPAKTWVKVGIVQLQFPLETHNDRPVFPPTPKNPEILKVKFLKYLEEAQKEKLDIVCFPEYSMTPGILDIISQRKIKNLIIVGGSYYKERKNTCPLIFNDRIWYIHKIHPSKYGESSAIQGVGMVPGDRLYLFDTPVGRIVVMICEDFRAELQTVLSQAENVDFLMAIGYNPSPKRFHEIADPLPPNHRIYILQCNVSEMGGRFGKSCVFGMIEETFAEGLTESKLKPDDKFSNKVTEIEGEGMIVAEFNIKQKTIEKVTSIDFQTIKNVRHVRLP